MTDAPAAGGPTSRLPFIDGLRGIAALSIAAYHLYRYEPKPDNAQQALPFLIETWFLYGWVVLPFLLVISGFVIPLSFRGIRVSVGTVANFFVRRLVRLSPPYYCTVLLVLLLHWLAVSFAWFPSPLEESPTWGRVGSHLIYAQDLLGYDNLSAGMWTVCIEVQFYLLFGLGLLLGQAVFPIVVDGRKEANPRVLVALFAPLALMSLFDWCTRSSLEPYVIYFMGHFFLGMATWWVLDGRIPGSWYWTIVSVWLIRLLWQWKPEVVCSLLASLAIYTAGRSGCMQSWLNFRWLQYLGKTSYSLYLIHYAVSHVATHVYWSMMGGAPSPPYAAAGLALALACSVAASHLLYVGLEVPSMRWSARLKPERSGTEPRGGK